MGRVVDPIRALCNSDDEDRDHLFFKCLVCKRICRQVQQMRSSDRGIGDWNYEFCWAKQNLQKKCFQSIVVRIAWCSFI